MQPRPLKWPPIFPLEKGLVLWLPFNERSGSKALDRSGKRNHGALEGPTWTPGKHGGALSFDGETDYLNCGNHDEHDFTSEDFSIMVQFYPLTWTHESLLGRYIWVTGGWKLEVDEYGTITFITFQAGASTSQLSIGDLLSFNEWSHIVITRQGVTGKTYLNGVDKTRAHSDLDDPVSISTDLILGNRYGFDVGFHCIINEVRVYNRALSAAEVKRLYEGELMLTRW